MTVTETNTIPIVSVIGLESNTNDDYFKVAPQTVDGVHNMNYRGKNSLGMV